MAMDTTRFGGNLERANVGRQPRTFTRPRPTIGTPNFRPPFDDSPREQGIRNQYQRRRPMVPFDDSPREQGIRNQYQRPPTPNDPGIGRDRMGIAGLGGSRGRHQTAGLWQDIKRILNRTKNPGPLIDQWTDHWNKYASDDTGIGSTNEYQMAELSDKQGNFMESGLGNPNWYSNFPDYFDTVTGKGDWKQKLGWKDEATEQEVIDKLNQMMLDRQQSLPWSTTT